ncbi:hypothetical protein DY000_02042344 [Brassica cretica]|uniref:Uncharacterized protein n=1 Tax=Brassica cretica TaxID=69181 RepID=A0ABQ7BB44_BRACR|nr:hypothetical protein DY000_02042344 [Brassica cretica]
MVPFLLNPCPASKKPTSSISVDSVSVSSLMTLSASCNSFIISVPHCLFPFLVFHVFLKAYCFNSSVSFFSLKAGRFLENAPWVKSLSWNYHVAKCGRIKLVKQYETTIVMLDPSSLLIWLMTTVLVATTTEELTTERTRPLGLEITWF